MGVVTLSLPVAEWTDEHRGRRLAREWDAAHPRVRGHHVEPSPIFRGGIFYMSPSLATPSGVE